MPPTPARKRTLPQHGMDERQMPLFDGDEGQEDTNRLEEKDWIAAILASSMFQMQKRLAARAALGDEEIRGLLAALAERGGKMTKIALAQRLRLPLIRVSGFINAARRLLNVDQTNVLMLDETEGTVTLNRALLETQFRETSGGAPNGTGRGSA
jgi:hypothetical protein